MPSRSQTPRYCQPALVSFSSSLACTGLPSQTSHFFLRSRWQWAPTAMVSGRGLPRFGAQIRLFRDNGLLVLLGIGFSLKLRFGPYMLAFPATGTLSRCNPRQMRRGNEPHADQRHLSYRSSPLVQPSALRLPASAWRISSSCSGELSGIGALGKPASRPWSLSAVFTFAGRFG